MRNCTYNFPTKNFTENKVQAVFQSYKAFEPNLNEPEINGSIISKLLSGIVLYASKDKREIGFKAKDVKSPMVNETVCIFTGEIPKNRLFLL